MSNPPKLRKKTIKSAKGPKHYACVRWQGKDKMLGIHGTAEARKNYKRFLAEIYANQSDESDDYTVTDVVIDYAKFAKKRYQNYHSVQQSLRELRKLYGDTPANEFGPKRFKTVRQVFVRKRLGRSTINGYMLHVIRAFRKAGENELVDHRVYHSLLTVERLRAGESIAKERKKIPAADESMILAAIAELPKIVGDMLRLQLLTGMRPGEVCILRPCDINRSESTWIYIPSEHKTEHHEKDRFVVIGPEGQEVLRPYLMRDEQAFCFSPAETVEQVRRNATMNRKTPKSCGNRPGSNRKRKPKRKAGACYTSESYRRAIHRACGRAFPLPEKQKRKDADPALVKEWIKRHRFNPNQVRKTTAVKIRAMTDSLETAQLVLGHASKRTTERYYAGLKVSDDAVNVMKKIG